MPISTYNENGTVNIYNSKTGETRNNVKPEELGAISPSLVAEYQGAQAPEKILERTKAKTELENINKPKLDEKVESAKKTVDLLESVYMGGEGEKPLAFAKNVPGGRIAGTAANIAKSISPGSFPESTRLNTFKRTLESSRAQLAKAAGDAGNLALQEQILAGKALPDENSTPEEAVALFTSIREKFGMPSLTPDEKNNILQQFDQNKESTKVEQAKKGLAQSLIEGGANVAGGLKDFLLSSTENLIRDVAQTAPATQRNISNENLLAQGISLTKMADKEVDLEKKKQLMQEAQSLFAQTSGEAADIAGGFSEQVQENPLIRGAETGIELGAATEIPSLLKNLPSVLSKGKSIVKGGAEKVSDIFKPKYGKEVLEEGLKMAEAGGKSREVVVKTAQEAGKKVQGNNIFKGIEQWAKEAKATATSSEAKQVDDLLSRAKSFYKGKSLNPVTAKTRWDTASTGFKSSGAAGETMKAGYHRAIRDALRVELDKIAPGFEKGTQAIRQGLEKEDLLKTIRIGLEREGIKSGLKSPVGEFAKKVGVGAAGTLAGGAALYALAKILGVNIPGAFSEPQ